MARFGRDVYERKNSFAERRMDQNREVDTLTNNQHDALATLCAWRHELHSADNARCLFYAERANHGRYWAWIDTDNYDNQVSALLHNANLPALNWSCDGAAYDTDYDFAEGCSAYGSIDEAISALYKLAESWNNVIEKYLGAIDKEYGTSYCPAGLSRR